MCHVLVIEEEWLIAEYIAEIAERAGGTSFDTVATEQEAVEAAEAHRPDIILSGLTLAAGTGLGAVRSIHERLDRMPVIFITGRMPELCSRDLPGVVLGKPIDERRVSAAFRALTAA